jgi:uncharacterized membrane protein
MEFFKSFSACISCNREIQDQLYDSSFLPNLFTIIVGFIVISLIVLVFSYFSTKKFKRNTSHVTGREVLNPMPLATASVVMGIGIGGFIDGILFHQILQLHAMVSNKLPTDSVVGKAVNMFWDGIFHALTLTAVIIGFALLIRLLKKRNINPSPRLAVGGAMGGWGIFNFVEGIIHHHIVKLHNVNEFALNPDVWNYAFLASGIIFMGVGYVLIYHRDHFPSRLG